MAEWLWGIGLATVFEAGFTGVCADPALAAAGTVLSSAGLDISSTVCRW
jgi:hypothetical protein